MENIPEKVQVGQAEVKDLKYHCAEGRICAYSFTTGSNYMTDGSSRNHEE